MTEWEGNLRLCVALPILSSSRLAGGHLGQGDKYPSPVLDLGDSTVPLLECFVLEDA